jgi:hypothetical protein
MLVFSDIFMARSFIFWLGRYLNIFDAFALWNSLIISFSLTAFVNNDDLLFFVSDLCFIFILNIYLLLSAFVTFKFRVNLLICSCLRHLSLCCWNVDHLLPSIMDKLRNEVIYSFPHFRYHFRSAKI